MLDSLCVLIKLFTRFFGDHEGQTEMLGNLCLYTDSVTDLINSQNTVLYIENFTRIKNMLSFSDTDEKVMR